MGVLSIVIPQIGEGLEEARVVALLKAPGDFIQRDEPLYQMETDKAVMDVESPYAGKLVAWAVQPGDVIKIGAIVASVEVEGETAEASPGVAPTDPGVARSQLQTTSQASTSRHDAGLNRIPPRTRAYAKEKGVGWEVLTTIHHRGERLLPEDVDAYLSEVQSLDYEWVAVSGRQRVLNARMGRSQDLVVPGTISLVVPWEPMEGFRRSFPGGADRPSTLQIFSFAVSRVLHEFPSFRTILVGDSRAKLFRHVDLGIAVNLENDDLVLAVVEQADTLNFAEFAARFKDRLSAARAGKDQATESTTLSITSLQSEGVRDAIPVVVAPAVATLFLGEVYSEPIVRGAVVIHRRVVNLALTFDHRIVNGAQAARFMRAVRQKIERIEETIGI